VCNSRSFQKLKAAAPTSRLALSKHSVPRGRDARQPQQALTNGVMPATVGLTSPSRKVCPANPHQARAVVGKLSFFASRFVSCDSARRGVCGRVGRARARSVVWLMKRY
jgi:hypothetical protein